MLSEFLQPAFLHMLPEFLQFAGVCDVDQESDQDYKTRGMLIL